MAGATGFTSQYTGSEIEQAISAYLNGDTRSTVVVDIADKTKWIETDVSDKDKGQYYLHITCTGTSFVGHTPDAFLIIDGVKVIPYAHYDTTLGNKTTSIWLYSNIQAVCKVVLIGSAPIIPASNTVQINPT